jgi:signal transduction histidine kinase
MIDLGEITLPSAASNIEARRKIFSVVEDLTADQIAASRLAAACSELCRHSQRTGAESSLRVCLDATQFGGMLLQLTLQSSTPLDDRGTHQHAFQHAFDELCAMPPENGVHSLLARKLLARTPIPGDAAIARLQAIVGERSRDELMADVQLQNVELEKHRQHLEDTVAKRTVQLRDAIDEAESANQAKSQFLANMSHELRTPMNAIVGYTEMLIEDAGDSGQEETVPDLERILAASKHLLTLINDVLDLSKIEAGKMELYCESFELRELIDDTASTVRSLVATNGNRLVLGIDDGLGLVHADVTKVRQSLFNLLSNASKFTSDGTITLSARREPRDEGEWIVLQVADTGVGVPTEKLDKVFEEFSQADASTTREYGGTGLGLPITKRFCTMMGGWIDAQSEIGKGTTFTIHLPVNVEEAAADIASSDTVITATAAETATAAAEESNEA